MWKWYVTAVIYIIILFSNEWLGLGIKEESGNHAWFISTLEKKI